MARIARQALRITELPLLTFGRPWQSVSDSAGVVAMRLFEKRYVELASRVLPPNNTGRFGWLEGFSKEPRVGASGVLGQVEEFRWMGSDKSKDPSTDSDLNLVTKLAVPDPSSESQPPVASLRGPGGGDGVVGEAGTPGQGPVLMSARAKGRFRILSVRAEEVVPGEDPLFVATVQIMEEKDVKRGKGADAIDYWTDKVDSFRPGTALVATQGAPVFEAVDSWRVVSQIPAGVIVIAAGPAVVVEGYAMVPIAPSGAVELTLFKERVVGEDNTMPLPSADDVKQAVLKITDERAVGHASGGGFPEEVDARRSVGNLRMLRRAARKGPAKRAVENTNWFLKMDGEKR